VTGLARAAAAPDGDILIGDTALLADPGGALYWPSEGVLAVADLHLEKGSSFAKRGVLLPPYDTATTLARLAILIAARSAA
jgi:metallophosphoesterase superfamily enzyme